MFTEVFNTMPLCAMIDDKILCMHGGISPELNDLNQINKIVRPMEIPDSGLICDIVWSDPDKNVNEWDYNERGISYVFGPKVLQLFM